MNRSKKYDRKIKPVEVKEKNKIETSDWSKLKKILNNLILVPMKSSCNFDWMYFNFLYKFKILISRESNSRFNNAVGNC